MTNVTHPDTDRLSRYQARSLDASGLLAVDRHLAGCEACREVLLRGAGRLARAEDLRQSLSEHLAFDQVKACAEGSGAPAWTQHLAECAACRAEVDDLRQFRV